MTRLVVFDVDDTLYLERDYVRSGFRAVSEHLVDRGFAPGFDDIAWALFVQGVRGDTFDRALAELGIDGEEGLVPELVEAYRGHAPAIDLLPDSRAAVTECRDMGAAIAVVTDGPPASQRAKIAGLGLEPMVDEIVVTWERDGDWAKPSPMAFSHLQRHFGMDPARCVYVADNPLKDFVGPAQLGWKSFRVRRPLSLHQSVPSGSDVDIEAPDLEGLRAWLTSTRSAAHG